MAGAGARELILIAADTPLRNAITINEGRSERERVEAVEAGSPPGCPFQKPLQGVMLIGVSVAFAAKVLDYA